MINDLPHVEHEQPIHRGQSSVRCMVFISSQSVDQWHWSTLWLLMNTMHRTLDPYQVWCLRHRIITENTILRHTLSLNLFHFSAWMVMISSAFTPWHRKCPSRQTTSGPSPQPCWPRSNVSLATTSIRATMDLQIHPQRRLKVRPWRVFLEYRICLRKSSYTHRVSHLTPYVAQTCLYITYIPVLNRYKFCAQELSRQYLHGRTWKHTIDLQDWVQIMFRMVCVCVWTPSPRGSTPPPTTPAQCFPSYPPPFFSYFSRVPLAQNSDAPAHLTPRPSFVKSPLTPPTPNPPVHAWILYSTAQH